MTDDFQDLLSRRNQRRAGCPDERIDAVLDQLKSQMVSALRRAADELGEIECSRSLALAARINSELARLKEVVRTFGGADA